ncbi:hypothetical protein F5Y14DRAFT_454451 [Nemania sp. NC0429]|nr:hypothetical protein F5Y14DRAFT_454451 [Nemania sp. NC0429]
MNLGAKLRDQLDDVGKQDVSWIRSQKRSSTFPLIGSEGWAALEKPHVLGTKPARSISLTSNKSRERLRGRRRPHPEPDRDPDSYKRCTLLEPDRDSDYDSDEEDRRNGVPITYSQDGGSPVRESMKRSVQADFDSLRLRGLQLETTVDELEERYEQLCELFLLNNNGNDNNNDNDNDHNNDHNNNRKMSNTDNTNNTSKGAEEEEEEEEELARTEEEEKEEFLFLENVFFSLRDELRTVEDHMGHKLALLSLLVDHKRLVDSGQNLWLRDEDATVQLVF